MQLWEVILIIICVSFVAITVYLIMTITRLGKVLDSVSSILADNSKSIESILQNIDTITSDTKKVSANVSETVDKVTGVTKKVTETAENNVVNIAHIKTVMDIAPMVISLVGFVKNRSDKKKLKRLLKEKKNR